MLIPAILKKEEIQAKMSELFYTQDMMFETGCMDNWIPDIVDNPDASTYQYAIVNNSGKLLGFICYYIDWYASCASRFGIISFDRGNPIIGRDLMRELEKLINDYKLHRIEWRMVGGNSVEKHYDKFCKKYNGKKHVLTDVFKDRFGNYRDDVIYEIINNKQSWQNWELQDKCRECKAYVDNAEPLEEVKKDG